MPADTTQSAALSRKAEELARQAKELAQQAEDLARQAQGPTDTSTPPAEPRRPPEDPAQTAARIRRIGDALSTRFTPPERPGRVKPERVTPLGGTGPLKPLR